MAAAALSPPAVSEEVPRSVIPQAASGDVHVDISSPARSDPTTAQATSSAIFFEWAGKIEAYSPPARQYTLW
eukprot:3378739-Rhodomonas_salina.1